MKVKEQFVSHPQPNKNEIYHARLEFIFFDIKGTDGNKGYFVKVSNLGDMEHLKVVSDDSDWNVISRSWFQDVKIIFGRSSV